jgi:cytoskeleton protein RodZ
LSVVPSMTDNLSASDIDLMKEQFSSNLPVTAGQMLKKARVDAGLHIAALAVSLRVPVKRIEALENGQMDQLPDMVFVRALTSSICQALKIDPAPILDKLPKAELPKLNHNDVAVNTPIVVSGASKDSIFLNLVTSPWSLGILLLSIGAAAMYFWPKSTVSSASEVISSRLGQSDSGTSQAKEVQVTTENTTAPNLTPSASLSAAPAAANTTTTPVTPAASVTSLASPVSPVSVAPVVAVTPVAPVTPTTAAVLNTAPTTAPAAAATAEKLVTFKASGQTWVEVKNAAGAIVFKKLLNEGEIAGANGVPPLTVIVGRADVTQVEVRGKPISLIPIAKSNVARFEVN